MTTDSSTSSPLVSYREALQECLSAMDSMCTQIEQMRDMFDDNDGAIAAALADHEHAVEVAEPLLLSTRGTLAVLDARELATVLAGLRTFQNRYERDGLHAMEHFDDVRALTPDEIDTLCERLNCD